MARAGISNASPVECCWPGPVVHTRDGSCVRAPAGLAVNRPAAKPARASSAALAPQACQQAGLVVASQPSPSAPAAATQLPISTQSAAGTTPTTADGGTSAEADLLGLGEPDEAPPDAAAMQAPSSLSAASQLLQPPAQPRQAQQQQPAAAQLELFDLLGARGARGLRTGAAREPVPAHAEISQTALEYEQHINLLVQLL